MSALPTPKFAVGGTVWTADTERVQHRHPCPDCLGTHKWKIETPAGSVMETGCMRCTHDFHDRKIAPLTYTTTAAKARPFIITGVAVSTTPAFGYDDCIVYEHRSSQCSSQHLAEKNAYATEAEALASIQGRVDLANAEAAAKPERLHLDRISGVPFKNAQLDEFKNGLWNAWYAYGSLVEKIEGYIEDKTTLGKEDLECLRSDLTWEMDYRAKDHPLIKLTDAVRLAVEADDPSLLRAAYDALPDALKALTAIPSENSEDAFT